MNRKPSPHIETICPSHSNVKLRFLKTANIGNPFLSSIAFRKFPELLDDISYFQDRIGLRRSPMSAWSRISNARGSIILVEATRPMNVDPRRRHHADLAPFSWDPRGKGQRQSEVSHL